MSGGGLKEGWKGGGYDIHESVGVGLVMYSLLVFDMRSYLSVIIALAGLVMCSNRSRLSATLTSLVTFGC